NTTALHTAPQTNCASASRAHGKPRLAIALWHETSTASKPARLKSLPARLVFGLVWGAAFVATSRQRNAHSPGNVEQLRPPSGPESTCERQAARGDDFFPLFSLTRFPPVAIAPPLFHVSEHGHFAAGGRGAPVARNDRDRWGRAETDVPAALRRRSGD